MTSKQTSLGTSATCCAVLCCPVLYCTVQMYCLLIRVEAGPEPNVMSYLVTNIVFLVGFFTLAVLLGEATSRLACRAWLTRYLFHNATQLRPHKHIGVNNLGPLWAACMVGAMNMLPLRQADRLSGSRQRFSTLIVPTAWPSRHLPVIQYALLVH